MPTTELFSDTNNITSGRSDDIIFCLFMGDTKSVELLYRRTHVSEGRCRCCRIPRRSPLAPLRRRSAHKQILDIYNVIQLSHLSSLPSEPSRSGMLRATSSRAPAFERGQTYRRSIIVAIFGRQPLASIDKRQTTPVLRSRRTLPADYLTHYCSTCFIQFVVGDPNIADNS